MAVTDLVNKGLITNIETLYTEKYGSLVVVFIEGRSYVPQPPKHMKMSKMVMARPPDFLDVDRMKVEVVGKEKEINFFNILFVYGMISTVQPAEFGRLYTQHTI